MQVVEVADGLVLSISIINSNYSFACPKTAVTTSHLNTTKSIRRYSLTSLMQWKLIVHISRNRNEANMDPSNPLMLFFQSLLPSFNPVVIVCLCIPYQSFQ